MAQKIKKFSADQYGKKENQPEKNQEFYFGKQNFKWMIIGLVITVLGFILMMGPDANTVDGKYDPNVWNEAIFSIRRVRIAPLMVIGGFVIQIFAILKRNKV
ncbi:Protein of unknown function [Halpernia humi]|uniref:DUF3098 domain-containing protein n=1 Tax=Halpernia humi TaxID=493375 RepID=A0A1H5TS96_9FLAO|nr:DUF3098 domain-containing protein [Halpernia humi]SEF65639.1 Protein of unknown function [Halpernia humi]